MLPKVATHILHHTSRAAAAVQNQTHAIRNVLQLQSSSGPSTTSGGLGGWNGTGSSSSSWGSHGTGAGGAKYNTGSRFYNGYTGAGRAVTQANTSSSHDGSTGPTDDSDELPSKHTPLRVKRSRLRSHSLSIHGRRERGEKLGVLRTVQLHARSRHAFAEAPRDRQDRSLEAVDSSVPSARPILIRRNSTSAPLPSESIDTLPPPPTPSSPRPVLISSDPAAPQTIQPPVDSSEEHESDTENTSATWIGAFKSARVSGNAAEALQAVRAWRSSSTPTTAELNAAIQTLSETRRQGEPLNSILEIYNEMVARSVLPNFRTYTLMTLLLSERDYEVHKVITSLELRAKRRHLVGRSETVQQSTDDERAAQLRAENNFGSAMALFEALTATGARKLPIQLYHDLLRSCSNHSNVDAAIQVFAHMETRPDILPTALTYGHLITVFTNAQDLDRAKEVFDEFRQASNSNRVAWSYFEGEPSVDENGERHASARRAQLVVWNKMIEAYFRCGHPSGALGLLEQMMDSPAGTTFSGADIPPPASSTFSQVIAGFCHSGDVTTALTWFNRLLEQESASRNPFEPSHEPTRPDQVAWSVMFEALAMAEMTPELNGLFSILNKTAARDGLELRAIDRAILFHSNMQYIEKLSDHAQAVETLDFLVPHVFNGELSFDAGILYDYGPKAAIEHIFAQYLYHRAPAKALAFLESRVDFTMRRTRDLEAQENLSAEAIHNRIKSMRSLVKSFTTQLLQSSDLFDLLSFSEFQRLSRLSDSVGLMPSRAVAPFYLHAYALAKARGELPDQTLRDWELLGFSAAKCDLPPSDNDVHDLPSIPAYAFNGIVSFLRDLEAAAVPLNKINKHVLQLIIQAVYSRHGASELQKIFISLGPENEAVLNNPTRNLDTLHASLRGSDVSDVISLPSSCKPFRVDVQHSRFVEEFYPAHPTVTPLLAYQRFEAGREKNVYPTPTTIGRLANALGRLGELDKVRILYDCAQAVLASFKNDPQRQSQGWFQIEDQMIIAYAHAGEMDAALVHRNRIIEQGGIPSPDAYGALIQNVKDTTDDTSNAMDLFQESQAHGVPPNIFLYNTIISKLSKARKADHALELFQQMKANNIQPSSITYGAVIAACARVGDAHSAELLFTEMASQKNFKPRIPPYNTMIQLYAHTKPDREKVLYYFEALQKAGIQPSAHSYKLLMDAYGTIEPVDIDAVEDILNRVQSTRNVTLQGSHWASMINAWGCVKKDLGRAIELFESIPSHPSTRRSSAPLPDAITFEALFNVIVTHRRTDLLSQYVERLQSSRVHMTAYIANQIIKGFATGGELEKARAFFESLADPPEGVAAPNNHVPHEGVPSLAVAPSEPVYREPSTWEAMVRGELGNGHRDRAVGLLERLQARKFPPAVFNRISGIMLDDSVSPWPASQSPSSDSF